MWVVVWGGDLHIPPAQLESRQSGWGVPRGLASSNHCHHVLIRSCSRQLSHPRQVDRARSWLGPWWVPLPHTPQPGQGAAQAGMDRECGPQEAQPGSPGLWVFNLFPVGDKLSQCLDAPLPGMAPRPPPESHPCSQQVFAIYDLRARAPLPFPREKSCLCGHSGSSQQNKNGHNTYIMQLPGGWQPKF